MPLTGGWSVPLYRAPDAAELALLFCREAVRKRGATWRYCKVMPPHMEALGAGVIARARFLDLLADAQASGVRLFG